MCNLCPVVDAAALAEVEAHLLLADRDAGRVPAHASRPLTAAERRAKVDFKRLDEIETTSVEEIRRTLDRLGVKLKAEVVNAVFRASDSAAPADVLAALESLQQARPQAATAALSGAAAGLAVALADAETRSAIEAAEEAGRQGAKAPAPARPEPSKYRLAGQLASGLLWDRITEQARKLLLDPARAARDEPLTRDEVKATLAGISHDGAVDNARQSLHTATADGRNSTAEEIGPESIWASEILDGNTCRSCAAIDGKEYATLEEARADYPSGPYARCDGGARCRGTLVFEYAAQGPRPTLPEIPPWDPADDPSTFRKDPAPRPEPTVAPVETPQDTDTETPDPPTATPPKRKTGKPQTYTALEEVPVLDAPRKLSPLEEAALMNPEHDPTYATKIYNNNCTNVATAYELRRRGYDVTAAPVPRGSGRTASEYLGEWWRTPEGIKPSYARHETEADALAALAEYPEGARGYVQVQWKSGGGHVFNWEKYDGEIRLLEGQNPASPDASDHLKRAKRGAIGTVRTDDLVPDPKLVSQAVQTRTADYLRDKELKLHLSSAEKAKLAKPTLEYRNGQMIIEPPYFRRKGTRWDPIPPEEREKMREEYTEAQQAMNKGKSK